MQRADSAFSVCGNRYAAGSYAIDLAQPAKRLIRTLLDADVPLPEDFVAEQQRRRAKGLRDQIYDVTAWSLPPVFGWLAEQGGIAEAEMLKTFNAGIGMTVVTTPEAEAAVTAALQADGQTVHRIGTVTAGQGVTYSGRLS